MDNMASMKREHNTQYNKKYISLVYEIDVKIYETVIGVCEEVVWLNETHILINRQNRHHKKFRHSPRIHHFRLKDVTDCNPLQ